MTFTPEELIISKPEFLRTKQKIGSLFTLIVFWSVFLYMLRPVVILIGWFLSVYILNETMSLGNLQEALIEPVGKLAYFLILMLVIFPTWMIYNKIRFTGMKDRRSRAEHRTVNESLATKMNIPDNLYEKAVGSRTMICCFDNDTNIVDIKELVPSLKSGERRSS